MNDIYIEISKLSDKFREMCYGITNDKEDIDNVVQELMLYFLQMNPDTIKKIWLQDGKKGIIRYGAVVIRRALTCKNNAFYYKYKKYNTHLDSSIHVSSITTDFNYVYDHRINYKTLENIPEETQTDKSYYFKEIDDVLEQLNWYDKKIFELYYYEGNTLDSLAKKTKISRNSLFTTIDKVRNILKIKLNE
tara:strand:- start:3417 stop:3989 length:573 start_codon:yes stop_codon:yes gene_type:complete